MANLKGVDIAKGTVGANTIGSGDEISAVIISTPAPAGLELDTPTQVFNLNDVKALGLDEAYDTANYVTTARQLREFYRRAGDGTKLYLMLVDQATTQTAVYTDSVVGAHDSPAKQLAIYAEGEIRQIATVANPTVAPVVLNGMSEDVYNAIPKAQAFAEWCFENFMPLQVLLEGRDYAGPAATAADLKAIPDVPASKVSVVIGQDWKYADALPVENEAEDPVYMRSYADVGTALGTLSAAQVNQSIGDNESFNLTDSSRDAWMIAGLSNHQKLKDQFNDLQTLENKGFIFGMTYAQLAGVRFNNDHTCVETVIDAEGNINEHTIAYGRTIDKAARLLRRAYLPKVKTAQPVNPDTGKLPTGVLEYFRGIGLTVLNDMQLRGEISKGDVKVDPDSDLIIEKVLKITNFSVVPYGYANSIEGSINIKRNL